MAFYTSNAGTPTQQMLIDNSGNVAIGASFAGERLSVEADGATVAGFNRTTDDGTIISLQQAGTEEGTISVTTTTISYNAFTGSHYGWTDRSIETGALVSLTGDNRRLHDNADSEIIYGVTPTSVANDPRILGAYLALQDSQDPEGPDNPHLVMAVGNGVMWVVDDGVDVEIGDYLISSDVAGHAMRDRGEFPISHIVAFAAESVDWDEVKASVDGRKRRRISVLFERFAMNHAVQPAGESAYTEMNQVKVQLSELRSESDKLVQSNEELARNNDELRTQLESLTAAVQRIEALALADAEVELALR